MLAPSVRSWLSAGVVVLWIGPGSAWAQGNGNLQIHFMNVGQGDAAVLISPLGEVVLFDNGLRGECDRPVAYLDALGVDHVDYHIASHYHDDHIGCTPQVLALAPLTKAALDRGGTYGTRTYEKYLTAVGAFRQTAQVGQTVTLDAGSEVPVTIEFVAANASTGTTSVDTENENDLSLVAVVRCGDFDAVIGGDLSGYDDNDYEDIESFVAPEIGQVEVYKVNHHGSRYSSNSTWLGTLQPIVGIISTGSGNGYGHPTFECLDRLHAHRVVTYWTEAGAGVAPDPDFDKVGGNIVVEVTPGEGSFTVRIQGGTDNYFVWESGEENEVLDPLYAWSSKSDKYHFADCHYVESVRSSNLERGEAPPDGKQLHHGCPK